MKYVLLNKKYEVVFKTTSAASLYEYVEKLYVKSFKEEYENKKLTYKELEEFACLYQRYLEFKSFCDYENYEHLGRLRSYLNMFDLMLAY